MLNQRLFFAVLLAALVGTGCKKSEPSKAKPEEEAQAGDDSEEAPDQAPHMKSGKAVLGGRDGEEPFTPGTHGFKFQNYGNEGGMENLTPAEVRRFFGDTVCADLDGDTCLLTPVAEQWMKQTNDAMGGGHCEGMATVSLFMELGKLAPSEFGGATAMELELAGNAPLQHEIAYWFATQAIAPMSKAEIRTMTPVEVAETLADAFKTGKESYTLGFYMPDWSKGHATTPYAVEMPDENTIWLLHYDNNYPGEERKIEIDRAANSWKYTTASDPKEAANDYHGDATTMTLTIAPTSVRSGELECPFCGDVGPAATDGKGSRQVILDGDADVMITDASGKRTGSSGGKVVNEIDGAGFVPVKSGGEDTEPVYVLPEGGAITVTLDGSTLTSEEPTDLTLLGNGYALGVYGVSLSAGDKDEIHFSGDWSQLSYVTDQAETPEIVLEITTETADWEFIVRVTGEEGGQKADIALDVAKGILAVEAEAKDGESAYEIEIHRFGDDGEQVFKHDGLALGADDRFVFEYGAWEGEGDAMEGGLDDGDDGDIDESSEISDE